MSLHPVRSVAIGTSLVFCAASPAFAQGQAKEPAARKRVLVYTVSAGFEHDVVKRAQPEEFSIVERALVDLGKKTGDFEAVVTRDPHAFTPEKLAAVDLVFFYTTGELPLSKDESAALLEFVKKGGAFAGAHCATDTFYKLPEYGEMIGAYFDDHPWHQEIRVNVEDREHPATKHLGASFVVTDEIYQFKEPYDRKKLHVLLSLDTSSVDAKNDHVKRKDGDFALAWCKDYGKGRVFYTALGHRPELWKDERYLAMLDGGFRWAMHATDGGAAKPEKKDEKKAEDKKGEKPPRAPAPLVPDGFAIDLIAQAPEILWPSSNTCLPDGSLLVGEDRMDMPGPTNEPLDRVMLLRWKADGGYEKTVFADKLFAVMGMAEVDGAVFVMNMPHLTRLVDRDGDGVAEERTEILTDLGPPAPGFPGGFNDHIVSGIRLAMDGWLYVAVGDKGIPGAHGTDGSTIQLRGGGVVRVRPDGSRLEVVATGLRNVLDVAIDERGEMFTYDNTDDGLGWWTRLTHVIQGGYYGYPWDYHEHTDRMLPCMAEYGGGSPTGGLAYREAAWPAEYQGNLFFCEWGKGSLRRFVLEPDGATFRVAKAEDFVRAGDLPAFKPLDVCESPGGRFLYLSDWGYEGWQNPKEAGRLWRIRRADDDPRTPDAAPPIPRDVEGCVAALGDPSFNRRLRAQRELERQGSAALPALRRALAAPAADLATERRRLHAARATDAFDSKSVDDLATELNLGSPVERRDAATALGRLATGAGPILVDKLASMRPRPLDPESASCGIWKPDFDPTVRFAVVQALRRLRVYPDPTAQYSNAPSALVEVMRDQCDPAAVEMLVKAAGSRQDPALRAAAIDVLASVCRKAEPWDGKWWSIQPAKAPPPPRTERWSETALVERTIREHLADPAPEARRSALEAVRTTADREALPLVRSRWKEEKEVALRALALDVLAALKDEEATELLAAAVRDPDAGLRKHAIDAVCAIRTPAMIGILTSIAGDPAAPAAHVVPCLAALGRLKEPSTAAVVARRVAAGDDEIRVAAVAALVDIEGAAAAGEIAPLLLDPSNKIRVAALRAYARMKLREATPKILPLADDEAVRDEAILALAAAPDPRACAAYLRGLARKSKPVQDASRLALAAIRDDVRTELEALCTQGKLDEPALATLQSIYSEPQPVLGWRILGPLKRGAEPRPEDGAPGLAWIDHRAEPKDGFVDLEKLLSGASEMSAYATADVRSATDREADMAVGSDDAVAVWVGGELVHEFKGNRAWRADEDRFRVKLRAGSNPIRLLVGNGTGAWAFNAKISGDPTGPLFARKATRPDVEAYRSFAQAHHGDPAHGFEIFRRSRDEAMCIRCHTVFGVGDKVGPELSDIGAKYGRDEILASVLTPSQRIAEGYRSTSIELQDGRVVFGMIRKETVESIELYDTNGELQRIDKVDVASRRELDTSVMPDGLWSTLSREDFADLVEWLTTLRGSPGAK